MADCELLSKCIFFNDKMSNKPGTAEMMKKDKCRGNKQNCARYMVFSKLGRENVPSDLFPNQVEKAKIIISQ